MAEVRVHFDAVPSPVREANGRGGSARQRRDGEGFAARGLSAATRLVNSGRCALRREALQLEALTASLAALARHLSHAFGTGEGSLLIAIRS